MLLEGKELTEQGRHAEAIAQLELATSRKSTNVPAWDYPRDARARLALGNLYARQLHRPERAREEYLRVLQAT